MSSVFLFLLLLLAAACLFFARRRKSGGEEPVLVEKSTVDSMRVICVYDMDAKKLSDTVDEFMGLYSDNGDVERPAVSQEGDTLRLTFTSSENYISICYWVNYLVYADEDRKHRYTVRGWYPFGDVELNGERLPFSNQTVMLYVDKDDRTYDNVSLVTPDGSHYLQPFAITGNLRAQKDDGEGYQPMPEK